MNFPNFLYSPLSKKNKWKQSFLLYSLSVHPSFPAILSSWFSPKAMKWSKAKQGYMWWGEEWCHSTGYWSLTEVRIVGLTGDARSNDHQVSPSISWLPSSGNMAILAPDLLKQKSGAWLSQSHPWVSICDCLGIQWLAEVRSHAYPFVELEFELILPSHWAEDKKG